jgi:hypothetical protein
VSKYWILTNLLGQYKEEFTWYTPLVGMLNGNYEYLINFPLWFLVCLFCAQLIFCILYKYLRDFSLGIQLLVFLKCLLLEIYLISPSSVSKINLLTGEI